MAVWRVDEEMCQGHTACQHREQSDSNVGEFAMTPEERIDQLIRIHENGGIEALAEFSNTNPAEFIEAIVAICNYESDHESDEEWLSGFRALVSKTFLAEIDELLTQGGFARFDEMIRRAREEGEGEAADSLEAYLRRQRH